MSLVERAELEILIDKGYSQRDIGKALNRNSATICRELKRKVDNRYVAIKAHHKAYVKRKYSKYQGMKIREHMKLEQYITKYLKQGWSPEQISGRIAKECSLTKVSHTSIYTWLRSIYGRQLENELSKLKKKRNKNTRKKVIQLEDRIFIDNRPKYIDSREYFGDWEGDFIVSCKGSKSAILVLHERKSRYIFIRKLEHKTTKEVEDTLIDMIKPLTNFKSLTLDNDISFVHHKKISKDLGVPLFFCHPYASWEKGGVENSNLYLRRWIPKGSDISNWSNEEIQYIESWMNSLPRKVLGFKTPEEVMIENDQLVKSFIQINRY